MRPNSGSARGRVEQRVRRFGPLGLRPRLLGALLLTSVVTLGVAALALLSPLEHRLREDGESAVYQAIGAARPEFTEVKAEAASGRPDPQQVADTTGVLRRRAGATVTILNGELEQVYSGTRSNLDVPDYYGPARRALKLDKGIHTLQGDDLVAAEPITIVGRRYVLIVVKRLQYVSSAVHVVQKAFIEAAGFGILIALLLGIGLTTTLLRRLDRLRDATRELERSGLEAPPPTDSGRDEIGELARAFASMQMRLRRQESSRRAFVATASHELRTPLTSLDGMLELLQDDLSAEHLDLEDARERTARAREQSRRLSHLASDLLDLSRLDAEVQVRSEPLELGELCRAVVAEFELGAAERGVSIRMLPPSEACWVLADPGAVARIVRILLDNALRVAPTETSIEMDARADRAWGEVNVRDQGPGITPEDRERIFERFERGGATEGQSGFGLGLAIGRELAERMGGSLELVGEPVASQQRGAHFSLHLPVANMAAEEPTSDAGRHQRA